MGGVSAIISTSNFYPNAKNKYCVDGTLGTKNGIIEDEECRDEEGLIKASIAQEMLAFATEGNPFISKESGQADFVSSDGIKLDPGKSVYVTFRLVFDETSGKDELGSSFLIRGISEYSFHFEQLNK